MTEAHPVHIKFLEYTPTPPLKNCYYILVAFGIAAHAHAGTVTNNANSGAGSLRNVLAAAINGEIITFAPSLSGSTITLTTGELLISNLQVTIDASSLSSRVSISGNNSSRIFNIGSGSNVSLKKIEIINGTATDIGAPIANGGGIRALNCVINLDQCIVRNCISTGDGGGMWLNKSSSNIIASEFRANQASTFGGAIYMISVSSPKIVNISNSLISGNKAVTAGGIFNYLSFPTISNCTIVGNSGYGINCEGIADPMIGFPVTFTSNPIIRNSIIWGNRASGYTNAISQIHINQNANPDVSNCLIEGANSSADFGTGDFGNTNSSVVWGSGNLNGLTTTPLFVSASPSSAAPTVAGDYRIFQGSSTINTGSNLASVGAIDLAGKNRIQQTTVDIGAYEGPYVSFNSLHPTLNPMADANNNGKSNFLDYAQGNDPSSSAADSGDSAFNSLGFTFLKFTRRPNAVDVSLNRETSTTLISGSWQAMTEGVHYTVSSTNLLSISKEEVVLKVIPLGPKRFYRQVFSQ